MAATSASATKEKVVVEPSDFEIKKAYKNREQHIISLLKKEKKVGVVGSEVYAQYLGSIYTFTLNGIPVSIKLNGKEQFYPESVAKVLQDKLNAIGRSNTRRVENVEI